MNPKIKRTILAISFLASVFGFAAGQPRLGLVYFTLTYVVSIGLVETFYELVGGLIFLLKD
jgi:hypothetical protein